MTEQEKMKFMENFRKGLNELIEDFDDSKKELKELKEAQKRDAEMVLDFCKSILFK